eukprot:GHVT01010098.1.p1 GENE.GHVT01010098.1~~GHVT01010098.1.p1  ORF type:complete len:449 (+),score=100.05 GHVT01010098.1:1463-2809(+)
MDSVTARFASGGSTTEVTEADLRQTARKAKKAHKNRSAPAQASAPSSALAILGSVVMIGAVVGAASYLMPSAPKTEVIQNNQNVYVVKPDTTVASNNVQPLITHQIPTMQVRQPATVDVMDIPQVRHYSNQLAKEHGWNYMQQCTEPNTATQLRGHRRLALIDLEFCKRHMGAAAGVFGTAVLLFLQGASAATTVAPGENTDTNLAGTTVSASTNAAANKMLLAGAACVAFAGVDQLWKFVEGRLTYKPDEKAQAGGSPASGENGDGSEGDEDDKTQKGDQTQGRAEENVDDKKRAARGNDDVDDEPAKRNVDDRESARDDEDDEDDVSAMHFEDPDPSQLPSKNLPKVATDDKYSSDQDTSVTKKHPRGRNDSPAKNSLDEAEKETDDNKAADEGGNNEVVKNPDVVQARRTRALAKDRDPPKTLPKVESDDEYPRHKNDPFATQHS